MTTRLILDSAPGDSGKGEIAAAFMARNSVKDICADGTGPSAARNVSFGRAKPLVQRQAPAGVVPTSAERCIGPGTRVDLSLLMQELSNHARYGFGRVGSRLHVDYRCALITENAVARETLARLHYLGPAWESGTMAARSDYLWRRARRVESIKGAELLLDNVPKALNTAARRGRRASGGALGPAYNLYSGTSYPSVTSDDCGVNSIFARTRLTWSALYEAIGVCKMVPVTTMPVPLNHELASVEAKLRGLDSEGVVSGHIRRVASGINEDVLLSFVERGPPGSLTPERMKLADPSCASTKTADEPSGTARQLIERMEELAHIPVMTVSAEPKIDGLFLQSGSWKVYKCSDKHSPFLWIHCCSIWTVLYLIMSQRAVEHL